MANQSRKPFLPSPPHLAPQLTHTPQNGLTHAFIFQFASSADRDYYIHADPVHTSFKTTLATIIDRVQVVDFTKDVFVDLRSADEVPKEQIVQPEVRYGGDIGKTEIVGVESEKSGAVGMSG